MVRLLKRIDDVKKTNLRVRFFMGFIFFVVFENIVE